MSGMQALFMNYGQTLSVVDSADFDGTNDYMTRGAGLTGAADSKLGIISFWCRIDAGDGTTRLLQSSATTVGGATQGFRVFANTTNGIEFLGTNAAASSILSITTSTNSVLAGATWRHVLCSFDMSDTAKRHLYLNDVSDLNVATYTNDTIDYTFADWSIGARPDGAVKVDGCFAEFYLAFGQYLDFSIIANRRRFISANGKPVWLGTDGAIPTGTAPLVYQRVADGAAVATFATNLGTGGNFSITGTLTAGSTSPSD